MFTNSGFAFKKSTQAINYFAQKEKNCILDKIKALKLLYFADRYHVRKYGRTITNDEYFAMNYGPVPSGAKDIIEGSTFLGDIEREYSSSYLEIIKDYNCVKSIKNVDESELSVSEIESLEFVWEKLGRIEKFDLADMTHKYPEWKKHEEQLKSGITSRIKMDLLDFLSDPTENIEKFYDLAPDEKEAKVAYLKELSVIESLWN